MTKRNECGPLFHYRNARLRLCCRPESRSETENGRYFVTDASKRPMRVAGVYLVAGRWRLLFVSLRGYVMPEPAPVQYDAKPWDRLPDEPPYAFLAFCAFRDMGPNRTVRGAYFVTDPKAPKANSTWFSWSTKYRWMERTAAFDMWRHEESTRVRRETEESEAHRIAENARIHRDKECKLAAMAFAKAREILAMPTVRNSFVEQRGGKVIIHKPTLLSPSHLFAAATLMKAGSDIGRKGLGIRTEDETGLTAKEFERLFYRTTGEAAADLPAGALPAPPANPAEAPNVRLPSEKETASIGAGQDPADIAPADTALARYKPPRDRP